MRRALLSILVLMLPLAALAQEMEGLHWRDCAEDSECVVIPAKCGKTSVSIAFADEARAYYKQQAKEAHCVARFWEPKNPAARCRPLGGAPGKTGGSCTAVGNPPIETKKPRE